MNSAEKDLNPSGKKIILGIVSFLYSLLVLAFTGMVYFGISMKGFPDGSLTEYDRATILPFTIFNWINFASSFAFFYLFYYYKSPHTGKRLMIAIFLHILFCVVALYGIEFYYKDYLGLNYGQGG